MNKLFLIISILILASVVTSVVLFDDNNVSISPTLVFGIIPLENEIGSSENFQRTFNLLEESTGMKVIPFYGDNYSEIVFAMSNGDVDIALLGGNSYVSAINTGIPLEIFATGVRADTNQSTYHSMIIANKNKITSFEDLRDTKEKQVFAFVDLLSTSGYLMPMEMMLTNNINPKYDFHNVLITHGHDNLILSVKEQRATAGATSDIVYNKMIKNGIVDPNEIIIIWESEEIQGLPFVMRSDLPLDVKERIKSAFYTMNENLESDEFLGGWEDIVAYVPVQKSDYEYAFRAWNVLDTLLE